MSTRERLDLKSKILETKVHELMDVSLALEVLADVARLAEDVQEVDPEGKLGLSFLAEKVKNSYSTIFKTYTMWMTEDLGKAKFEIRQAVNDLLAQTKTQKPGPEEEEDINDGCGCED
ncbi:hypothetical protein [Thermosulfurimonas dismutans]|uniref:Uncharacterized protein n=1 Tax=Thermosulfurimonas dismutans TaxID=999894 RepID=A0A179D6Y8_9BACT|nr:hypothetical protein [Thermosulfurimonas dismutans]OAQ21854.1 hypothetical protein TDIS_0372 [Thermosulfurimonas dismutans]